MIQKPKVKVGNPKEMVKIKISILGEGGTGKSCITSKYCTNTFENSYNPTIAVDYRNKIVPVKNVQVNVNVWDFSGHPEFFEVRNEFYKETNAIILVYDITSKKSLDALDMWISEANKYGATDCYVVVCGNKKDNPKRTVNEMEAKKWAENRGFSYFEVSAKEGTNIETMFEDIIYKTVPKDKLK